MPYLTFTDPRYAATADPSPLGLGVPGCAHPLLAPASWAELARPRVPLHWTVLNVAHGPGSRFDPLCREAAERLRTAGVRVLGYLDACFGARPFEELLSQARRFADWYRVGGFYLDRCPTVYAEFPQVRRTTTALRTLLDGGYTVLGHGRHPCPDYAEAADQLVTFSGPWAEYRWSQAAQWTAEHPPERFCHLVYGVPRPRLEQALRIARWQGAATICFTDRARRGKGEGPWSALPGYWDDIVSLVGPGVSE